MAAAQRYALYPVRIALALVFFAYAMDKATQFQANIQWFAGWGVPWPQAAVPIVMVLEFAGALLLLLGVATRATSIVLGSVLVGVLFTAKRGLGIVTGIDLEIAILGGLAALALNGPGQPTLATIIQEWRTKAPSPEAA